MKFKKILICVVSTLIMCSALIGTASAANVDNTQPLQSSEEQISPQAEETVWYTRVNSKTGKVERRLWSITKGIWLTEWLPVE